jgi:hypothetical protein
MEMSQGNSLYGYLKKTKCHSFSFTKSENRRAEQIVSGELVLVGVGTMEGKVAGG